MESVGAVAYRDEAWVETPEEGKGKLDELRELLLPFLKLMLFMKKSSENVGYSGIYTAALGFPTLLPSKLGGSMLKRKQKGFKSQRW